MPIVFFILHSGYYKEYCHREGLVYRQDRTRTYGYSDERRKKKPVDSVDSVDKSGESGIIRLNRTLDRRDKNIGAFSVLEMPMQKKTVISVCKKYVIDTKGLTFKIQRSEKLLSIPFYGSTDYDNVGRIDLFPNAFINEDELVKTILHEKCHVLQLKRYGKMYSLNNIDLMEKKA